MKIVSPEFWFKYHIALIHDSFQKAVDAWSEAETTVKYWIMVNAVLFATLFLLFALLQGGQS